MVNTSKKPISTDIKQGETPLFRAVITEDKSKPKKPAIPLTKEEKKEIKARIAEINHIYDEPSTQNAIPYSDLTKDGVAIIPKKYFSKTEKRDYFSKTLEFSDINYQLASDDDQNKIFDVYSDILNYFEDEVYFQLTFESRKRDNEVLVKKIVTPEKEDNYNSLRNEYSDIIKGKLTEGENGNELVKFLTFGLFAKNLQEARTKLNSITAEIISLFQRADVIAKTLNGTKRLGVMYRALNPYRRNRFLFNWDYARKIGASTKDFIAPSSMFFDKKDFELGDCYGSIMSINLIASELKDRILYDFLNQNQLLCLNIHVKPFDILTGQKIIDNTLLNVKSMKADKQQKLYAQGGDPNNLPGGMEESIEQLEDLLKELKSKNEKLFQITLTIRSYAHSPKQMKLNCDTLRRICQSNSCILIPCDYQQSDGLCSSLPLGVTKVLNKRILHTSSLAVFMPFTSKELFHIDSLRFSYYGVNALTRNLILADKSTLKNPNSLILGTPGSGKSFSVKREIIDVFIRVDDDIFICDPEGEYFLLVHALGGQVIKLSSTSQNHLNPMDIIFDKRVLIDEHGAPENPIPDKIDFVISLIELIVGDMGLSAPERSLIDRAAKKIYENFIENAPCYDNLPDFLAPLDDIDGYLDTALAKYAEKMPVLEDLYNELVSYGEYSERLTASLEMFVYGSQKYFNNSTNVNINNRTVCFDIRTLGTSLKKLGMLIVQETVWNRVSANRSQKKTTRYYIDEFHLLLKAEQTAKYTIEIWKRFRKWYGIPCGITQNVKDFLQSEQVESIFENTDFYYLLNQAPGDREILKIKLNISDTQADFITNSEAGCGLINFGGLIIPFEDKFPQDTEIFKYLTTKPGDNSVKPAGVK